MKMVPSFWLMVSIIFSSSPGYEGNRIPGPEVSSLTGDNGIDIVDDGVAVGSVTVEPIRLSKWDDSLIDQAALSSLEHNVFQIGWRLWG